jgi:hypothetical protein
MAQSLEQTFGVTKEEIKGTNKQIKRALMGRFGFEREIPKMEAACLLVRRGFLIQWSEELYFMEREIIFLILKNQNQKMLIIFMLDIGFNKLKNN